MSDADEPISLKQVQLRLGVAQHVLIHLCEKGVIVPDFAETEGRGKRREFSQRNLFEFGVALAVRELELPVATAAFIVRLLRAFERATAKSVPGFAVPSFLLERRIDLGLHFFDGRRLVIVAKGAPLRKPLLLAASVADASRDSGTRPRFERLDELPSDFDTHLDVNLTRIARRALG